MTAPRRKALITGASAGIGATFARQLAARGHDLLLVARRRDRLQDLANELARQHQVQCEVLSVDLASPGATATVMAHLDRLGWRIDFLVNNAGLSGHSKFAASPWAPLAGEIQLMMSTLTELTHAIAPGMIERRWGRIINVSSLAALSPPGESLLYSAIKSYVLVLSQSLDMEFKPHGVHVTALCPGFTHSEFHDVMGTRNTANRLPRVLWQQPEDVVEEAIAAVTKGKPVCVPGRVNKFLTIVMRPMPLWMSYLMGRTFNPFK
ncbi:MAG: SDR family oxidoreductase [Aquabacterium sp.]|uniref:SDR family NAD(P)-dependent oxidoreductase n=1 Tax=Aquabacterium sp. TaxID=1872578 RepID=UPI001228FA6E|nr:SDR family oxidoreductase [Aquabacterium sp.]TAK96944.1 MAG: SDR family oxidoreductase [Aquabacterium sp.]